MRKLLSLITSFFLLSFFCLSANAEITKMERFERAGAVFAESLGDSIPELERKGFTVNGNPTCVDTPYGRGMSFDGTGDYLSRVQQDLNFTTSNSFSGAAWVKLNEDANGYVFTKRDGSTGWGFYYYATGGYYTLVDDAGIEIISGFTSPTINTWHHVAFTYDGTTLTMYLDGVLSGTGSSVAISSNTHDFIVGDRTGGSSATQINADITDALVFPRALSAQEVSDLYNQTSFNYMDNLVSRWDMSEINPKDLIGSNNGTGTSIVASDIVVGQHGDAKAIDFDGSNDYVTVSSPSNIDFQGSTTDSAFSVFVWAKPVSDATSRRIISKGDSSSTREWLLQTGGADTLSWTLYSGGDFSNRISRTGATPLTADQWAFVGGTYDGSRDVAGLKVYLNGANDNGGTDNNGTYAGHDLDGALNIARFFDSSLSAEELGGIYIFSSELTELQARDLYEQTRSASKSTSRINDPAYLKGYWPLNSNTDDYSGNGNDGTPTSLTYADGQFGRTVGDFNGSSSSINMGSDSSFNFGSNDFTISGWFNASSNSGVIVGKYDTDGDQRSWFINTDSNGYLQLGTSSNGSSGTVQVIEYASDVIDGGWHHFVWMKSGASALLLFDGEIVSTTGSTQNTLFSSTADLIIGRHSASSQYFDGVIANIRIYPTTLLTPEEAQQIYSQEQFVPKMLPAQQPYSALPDRCDTSLVGAYLNSATNGTAKDYSDGGRDGTNVGAILGNNKVEFDGASYISISDDDAFDTVPRTIAATFRWDNNTDLSRMIAFPSGFTDIGILVQFGTSLVYRVSEGPTKGIYFTPTVGQRYRVVIVDTGVEETSKMYIDGVEVGTKGLVANFGGSIGDTQIGARQSNTQHYSGDLYDVEIYNEIKDEAWASQDYAKRVPDNNLRLWINGGEKDLSRYNHVLTNDRAIFQNGIKLSGISATEVSVADNGFLTFGDGSSDSAMSYGAWFNLNEIDSNQALVSKSASSTTGEYYAIVNTDEQIDVRFVDESASATIGVITSADFVEAGKWYHMYVTYDGSGVYTGIKLYINGELVSTSESSGGSYAAMENTSQDLLIGRRNSAIVLNGTIDDIKLFSGVKSSEYINNNYLQTRGQY